MTKKTLYISLFTLLGIIVSFLIHAFLEISILNLLIKDFRKYGLGLSWSNWYLIHHIGSLILLMGGIVLGYKQGKYWWRVIYVEHKYRFIK